MKIVYDKEDLKKILTKHHSYGNEPIKVGYTTLDVLDVRFDEQVISVTLGNDDDED